MQKIWHGIFWKIFSCGCFAGINIIVRYLSGGSQLAIENPLPIYTIMFFQHLIGVLIISLWMWQKRHLLLELKTSNIKLHALRVVLAALGIGLWYLSLRHIPVTQVVALSFIAPIITVLAAVIFLHENFGLSRKIAVILSIAGSFLITRPDLALTQTENYSWYMLLPLLGAFVFSLDKILTRRLLTLQENPRTLTWFLLAFICPLCVLPMLYYGWVMPDLTQWSWLFLLGILGALAHYSFNKAYALAEVTILLPFGTAKLLMAAVLSYAVFYELPNTLDIWLGIAIIMLSTIVLQLDGKTLRFGWRPADNKIGAKI